MIVEIKRVYLKSGLELPILINTNYIMKVETTNPSDEKPRTRIVYDSGTTSEGPDMYYTDETYANIKAKVTRQRRSHARSKA